MVKFQFIHSYTIGYKNVINTICPKATIAKSLIYQRYLQFVYIPIVEILTLNKKLKTIFFFGYRKNRIYQIFYCFAPKIKIAFCFSHVFTHSNFMYKFSAIQLLS